MRGARDYELSHPGVDGEQYRRCQVSGVVGLEVAAFVQSPLEGRFSQPLACRALRAVVPDAFGGWSGGTDVISPKCFGRAQQK
jgi:hypothetical protein